jgi:hypothetical protein
VQIIVEVEVEAGVYASVRSFSLRFDRERLWYEFLRAGFSAQDLKRVLTARRSRRSSPVCARNSEELPILD